MVRDIQTNINKQETKQTDKQTNKNKTPDSGAIESQS
jgi:hypothetical protein